MSRRPGSTGTFLHVALICAFGLAAQANAADDAEGASLLSGMDFISKVSIGHKSSELRIRDRKFTPDFTTLDIAVTGALGSYFLTLDNDFSVKDAIETDPNGLIFYSRSDTNITAGYTINRFSFFGGWRTGETDAHFTGSNNSFGTKSRGYYVGSSGSQPFSKVNGTLYGSLAIARLTGEVSLTEPFVDTSAFVLGNAPSSVTGKSIGFSIAVGWSGNFAEATRWNLEYKLHRFEFEDDEKYGGVDLSYEENFQTVYLGLTHFF